MSIIASCCDFPKTVHPALRAGEHNSEHCLYSIECIAELDRVVCRSLKAITKSINFASWLRCQRHQNTARLQMVIASTRARSSTSGSGPKTAKRSKKWEVWVLPLGLTMWHTNRRQCRGKCTVQVCRDRETNFHVAGPRRLARGRKCAQTGTIGHIDAALLESGV